MLEKKEDVVERPNLIEQAAAEIGIGIEEDIQRLQSQKDQVAPDLEQMEVQRMKNAYSSKSIVSALFNTKDSGFWLCVGVSVVTGVICFALTPVVTTIVCTAAAIIGGSVAILNRGE